MKTVEEYRQHAKECRRLAKLVWESVVREQLIRMAEMWDGLAADREAELRVGPDAPAEQRTERD